MISQELHTENSENNQNHGDSGSMDIKPSELVLAEVRKRHQSRAMSNMVKAAGEVSEILKNAPNRSRGKRWQMEDIEKMEQAAREILEAARELQTL